LGLSVASIRGIACFFMAEESGSSLSHSFVKAAGEEKTRKLKWSRGSNKGIPKVSASKLADTRSSPFPLLSMISTDQWFPNSIDLDWSLADQFGKVEKWEMDLVSVTFLGLVLTIAAF
jgi:hypothetical protein